MAECKLWTPIQVGSYTFKNRIVMAPMETRLSTPEGDTTKEMCDYYAERAKGGAAAIIVENTFVDTIAARSSLVSSGLYSDHLIAGKFKLAEAIKDNGAVAILQISHGGIQASAGAVPGVQCVGPSPVASKVVGRMPRELSIEEIEAIEDAFAQAARRAKQAGFDGVEIHGAHGYLICSFLSPYTNKRTDKYGGSFENRARFPINIIRKIREQVGPNFLVGYRLSGEEKVEGGLTIKDTCGFGQMIEDQVDYIHVSVGIYETMATWMISPLYCPQAPIVDLASAMKKAVTKTKVIAVNALNAELGEKALENDDADLIAYGRALLADPQLPNKIKSGRFEDILPCMRGHEGCISLFFAGCPIRCEVNPPAGREGTYQICEARQKKNVVVVGGGLAGMEAARVAELYGHKVTLIEMSNMLGGHFIEATIPKFKAEARGVLEWERTQIAKSGVNVMMNTEATSELVKELQPDALIIAVGSDYILPEIPGIEAAIGAETALMEPEKVGVKAIVIGGGLVGAETALYLGQMGKEVTILEQLDLIVPEDEPLSQIAIGVELETAKVKIQTGAKVVNIAKDGATYKDKDGNHHEVEADTVIAAFGLGARKAVAAKFDGICSDSSTFIIGDAVKGRKIFDCMHEAWKAVRKISGVM
ncbi:FAD-dependent oxidoreductase [Candidatus Formimonas warabiya]|uniref:FAD-dependent oxidoreductase n=1 Tax=Formimonas warabiya TaxID=1761012 RepID=A0A3G1KZ03_FORW1|nr:FAD-dependent oxidoreductase [Candidatus Formimonas warabiya]ATW27691.1 hypothetical protein DCMF_25665 [Candidatus Formimonas warabiya]